MICSCCGYEIIGKSHSVEKGERNVCEKCWNNPDMFFPEKIEQDERLSLLSEMAQAAESQNGMLEVRAIKLVQKDIEMYVGKMKVNDILNLYELDKFNEEELEGYQREQYEERTSQLVEYLAKSPLAVMPALLVSLRETNFIPSDGDLGILRIERKKGSLWIIDGQHRIGGFSKICDQFMFSKSLGVSLFSDLMNYEFPVVFVDSESAAERIKQKEKEAVNTLSPQDIEKTIFFVVNKTQRGISPSLKDALLYSIRTSGIKGLSLVDKEGWRIVGAQIGITLNCRETSPLRCKINISGQRNSGKPIKLNTFVSSLEPLFRDKEFIKLSNDDKLGFLEAYWSCLREFVPEAFETKEKTESELEEFGRRFKSNIGRKKDNQKAKRGDKAEKRYLILTAIGIYAINRLAKDLLHLIIKERLDFKSIDIIRKKLEPIQSFEWEAKASDLSLLGGMKGVGKAYDLLSSALGLEKDAPTYEQSLGKYTRERE
jgi:DGQHR domain-containing protein